LGWVLRTIKAPITVNYEVTPACNLYCAFCYKESGCTLVHPPLNQVFEILNRLCEAEVFELGLFGGEFFFYPHWREVMEYAFKKGFFLSFVSNGTCLDEDAVALMKKCNIRRGAISIHGPRAIHDKVTRVEGTYEKAVRALELCLDAGIYMTVLTTVTRDNLGLLHQTVEGLNSLGLVRDNLSYGVGRLCPYGRGEEEWKRDKISLKNYLAVFAEIQRITEDYGIVAMLGDAFPLCRVPKKYHSLIQGCWMATGFGHITYDGAVKGCGVSQLVLGNLLKTPLQEIWQSQKMQEFRKLHWLPEQCGVCSMFCGGGCIASRISSDGYAPDEFLDL